MGYQVFVVGFIVFLLAACGKPGDAIIPPEASKYDQIKAKLQLSPRRAASIRPSGATRN